MKTLFIRLLGADDKSAALHNAIAGSPESHGKTVFSVDPETFAAVPRTPFSYWVSEHLARTFVLLPPFDTSIRSDEPACDKTESVARDLGRHDRTPKQGLATADDFRFVRIWIECPTNSNWFSFAKGGNYSPFYASVHLCLNWAMKGAEISNFSRAVVRNESFYFRPGLTWPRRTTSGLSMRVMPAGCIFADKGPAAFVDGDSPEELLALLAVAQSSTFSAAVQLQLAAADAAARSYEVGVIQRTPVPELSAADRELLAGLARRAWALKRSLDTRNETSHAFELPALLSCIRNASSVRAEVSKHERSLAMRAATWGERVRAVDAELAAIQAEIDERCFDLYGIGEEDRRAIAPEKDRPTRADGDDASIDSDVYTDEADAEADDGDEADETAAADAASLTAELVSWAFGVAFGRFDVRLATGGREPPPAPEPFDPLPACSAGMLTGADGLPCAAPPEGYPVAFPANGILVDDPGHPRDIEPLLRSILDAIVFAGQPVEQEICEILGVKSLREYFRKPALFFADHLKRYSKSRRKAPIYWPLSTASGSYTLWVYYHRLTDQTLYACITDFVEPKIADVEKDLARVRGRMGEAPSAKDRKAAEELESLLHELKDFRDELLRVAKLPYKPDLNDGVLVTACPLAKLFLHKPWQKELLACWKKLEAGEYDWAHLALSIWPARVRDKCKTDKSLAIAHDLESLYTSPPASEKKPRGRKKPVPADDALPLDED